MATPSKLKPGDLVRRKDRADAPIFMFLCRHGSYCRCQCDAYRGMAGPDDKGFVDVSNWNMARMYERVSAPPSSACTDSDNAQAACPVCGSEVRGQGGYLSCECPVISLPPNA